MKESVSRVSNSPRRLKALEIVRAWKAKEMAKPSPPSSANGLPALTKKPPVANAKGSNSSSPSSQHRGSAYPNPRYVSGPYRMHYPPPPTATHKRSPSNQLSLGKGSRLSDGKHTLSSSPSSSFDKQPIPPTPSLIDEQQLRKAKDEPKKEEVDPAIRRARILNCLLLTANAVALALGILALTVAGFADPRPIYQVSTFGGQLTLVSVYMIITSLAGLYGVRRESVTLLVIYGALLTGALFFRWLLYFISSDTRIAFSLLAAFLEVLLILSAWALALDVRQRKLLRHKELNIATPIAV